MIHDGGMNLCRSDHGRASPDHNPPAALMSKLTGVVDRSPLEGWLDLVLPEGKCLKIEDIPCGEAIKFKSAARPIQPDLCPWCV